MDRTPPVPLGTHTSRTLAELARADQRMTAGSSSAAETADTPEAAGLRSHCGTVDDKAAAFGCSFRRSSVIDRVAAIDYHLGSKPQAMVVAVADKSVVVLAPSTALAISA